MLIRVLLALDPAAPSARISALLAQPGTLVVPAPSGPGLWQGLARESYDLVVVHRAALAEPASDVVATLRKLPDRPEVVVLQSRDDAADRAALLAAGALAALPLDLPDAALAAAFAGLLQRRREAASTHLDSERSLETYRISDFVSASPAMRALVELARRVAASDSSLLLLGETGVGKEWLARAIHAEGPRERATFYAVNCAALPDSLLESELFGHEKGAFTGAVRARRGCFELAHRGTIFLDEIAEMSPHLQAKLLRVLQERCIQRLGAEQAIEVDVRIMAATNRDPEEAIAAKALRKDLYYRLGVVALTLPPLRDRREDVPALVGSYLERFRVKLAPHVHGVRPEAMEALVRYAWPGNVRELINVMERAVLLCAGAEIGLADLPDNVVRPTAAADLPAAWREEWLSRPLAEVRRQLVHTVERRYLEEQLERSGGRIGETARRAGIDPRSLYDKMKALGLRKEDFKRR